VRLDRVPLVVKDRPGTKVGLGHPERSLDLPQVVIGADTGEGWLYLATVIDLATRMVVGWQLADHIRTSLVVDASGMGIDAGLVAPNAIFTPIAAVSTRLVSSPSSAPTTGCGPASAAPACAGTTPGGKLLRRPETRCTTDKPSPPEPAHDSPSPSRSRSSTTPTAALHPRLPHPVPGTHRPPPSSNRRLINNPMNCPRSLTQPRRPARRPREQVAVARAAALHTSRLDGSPLVYNLPDPRVPLVCRPEIADEVVERIASGTGS
jgi:hypothetical protein